MFSNNLKRGKQFEYISINHDGKEWFAWFQEIVDSTEVMSEALKPEAK